jgi:hypothetical protein
LRKDGVSKNGNGMMQYRENQTYLETARQMTIIFPKTTTTIGT